MEFFEMTPPPADDSRFEVFFDGDCPLCRREIAMIRKKDVRGELKLTDIASENFQAVELPLETLMREIHGRYPNGQFVVGVEVFREIYQRLGFSAIVKSTRWPLIRQALDLGYRVFARVRFHFAMRRIKKRIPSCKLPSGATASLCEREIV